MNRRYPGNTTPTPNDIAILAYWFSRTQLHANYQAHERDADIMLIRTARRERGWTPAESVADELRSQA